MTTPSSPVVGGFPPGQRLVSNELSTTTLFNFTVPAHDLRVGDVLATASVARHATQVVVASVQVRSAATCRRLYPSYPNATGYVIVQLLDRGVLRWQHYGLDEEVGVDLW